MIPFRKKIVTMLDKTSEKLAEVFMIQEVFEIEEIKQ